MSRAMQPTALNDRASYLSGLATRRSGKPRDLVEPGPSRQELRAMLAVAARTPDHGKLAPWRFVTVAPERREPPAEPFGQSLHPASGAAHPQPIGLQAGRRVGKRDGLRARLCGVLQQHGDQRPERDVVVKTEHPEDVSLSIAEGEVMLAAVQARTVLP